jgi:hypothetical protein
MARKQQLERVVQAKVDRSTWKKLVAAANEQDVSVSCVVRRLIEGHLSTRSAA